MLKKFLLVFLLIMGVSHASNAYTAKPLTTQDQETITTLINEIQHNATPAQLDEIYTLLATVPPGHKNYHLVKPIRAFVSHHRSALQQIDHDLLNPNIAMSIGGSIGSNNEIDTTLISQYYKHIAQHNLGEAHTINPSLSKKQLQQWYSSTTYIMPFNIFNPPRIDVSCVSADTCRFYVHQQEQHNNTYNNTLYRVTMKINNDTTLSPISSIPYAQTDRTVLNKVSDVQLVTYTYTSNGDEDIIMRTVIEQHNRTLYDIPNITQTKPQHSPTMQLLNGMLIVQHNKHTLVYDLQNKKALYSTYPTSAAPRYGNSIPGGLLGPSIYLLCTIDQDTMLGGPESMFILDTNHRRILPVFRDQYYYTIRGCTDGNITMHDTRSDSLSSTVSGTLYQDTQGSRHVSHQ